MSDELESDPQPASDAPPPAAPKSQKTTWIVATVVSLALGVGAIAGVKVFGSKDDNNTNLNAANAGATTNGAATVRMFGNAGKITKIDGGSFTLQSQDFNGNTTTVNVKTDGDTKFTDTVEGAVSSLKVGQTIIANGTTTDGVFTAERINPGGDIARRRTDGNGTRPNFQNGEAPPNFNGQTPPTFQNGQAPAGGPGNFGSGNFLAGEITKIDGATITVKDRSGAAKTITVTDATKVMVTKTIKLSDLKVGDNVRVGGDTKNNVLQADTVTRGDQPFGGGLRGGPATQQNSAGA